MIHNDTVNHTHPTNTMSSKIKIVKICEFCNKEFIAQKTTTKCCSHNCAKRLHKLNLRNDKIAQTELKTDLKRRPEAYITEEQFRVIQAKEFLTLKEAAMLLNVSPLTLRRWTLAGEVCSTKVGKKHCYSPEYLRLKFFDCSEFVC